MSRTSNVLQNVLHLSSVAYFNSVAIYLKHARRLYTTLAIERMTFSLQMKTILIIFTRVLDLHLIIL
jgi:hypothetical protein